MTVLIIGLAIFLGVHSIAIVAPAARQGALAKLGEGGWKGLYSLLSAVGLVLLLYGFHLARQSPVVLYTPPPWLRHVTFLLMLPVFPLILAAYLPGRIKTAMKHPLLAAVKFWALAHLLSNGTLADVLLFGGFLAWAVLDRISLKHRAQAIRTAPAGRFNDLIAIVLGLALYVLFIGWAHRWLFGVSPLG
ncbi:MAG TPA: NnrU family protein [Steroidobacteraceae bacterium]|nr:NnrU family protein [Steroidobacteraceae bacterium]